MNQSNTFIKYGLISLALTLCLCSNPAWAKRTITGRITMPDGTPAKNLGVVAWDSDGIGGGGHDPMGKAVTNSQGQYTIKYGGGPWDTKVAGSTSFRPDIFLTIHAVQAGVHPVKQTGVKENWMMSKDLVNFNVQVPAIMGKIYGARSSLLIQAYDQDGWFGGKDDFIGCTKTLPDGRYMLLYGGKHYDATPPSPGTALGYIAEYGTGLPGTSLLVEYIVDKGWSSIMHRHWTDWRPDIYLKVKTRTGCGLSTVKQSKVYKNWPHRKNLKINFTLSADNTVNKVRLADFNGDGKADIFATYDGHWHLSYGSTGRAQKINKASATVNNLRLADFNGDRKGDVFATWGGQWYVSYGGTGSWQRINTSNTTVDKVRLADLNGDGKADVFSAWGGHWYVSYGGTSGWQRINTSNTTVDKVRLADLNGDGKADVFSAWGGHWYVSYGGTGKWQEINRTGATVDKLRFADINGDGKTDALATWGGDWYIASGGRRGWQRINKSENIFVCESKLDKLLPTKPGMKAK